MKYTLQRLSAGLGLIALASAVLLLADLPRREGAAVRVSAPQSAASPRPDAPLARRHVVILAYDSMVEAEESTYNL